jgi:hypothetical protein
MDFDFFEISEKNKKRTPDEGEVSILSGLLGVPCGVA